MITEKKGNPDKGVVVVPQRFLYTFLLFGERKVRQERESESITRSFVVGGIGGKDVFPH